MFWDHINIRCTSPKTLRACALTCKVWREAARHHIFRSIVLRNYGDLRALAADLVRQTDIGGWVHKIRLCGSLPPSDDEAYAEGFTQTIIDRDRWIYWFPSVFGIRPLNVKILELFNFAHLSPERKDLEAFSRWTSELSKLPSVEVLNFRQCEMAPLAMTAIVRALPRLTQVGLNEVDLTVPGTASIEDLSSSKPFLLTYVVRKEVAARKGLPVESVAKDFDVSVKYKLLQPKRPLQSLYIDNTFGRYRMLQLSWLFGWADSADISSSLKELHLGPGIDMRSVSTFITDLGTSPSLEHLNMYVGCDTEFSK